MRTRISISLRLDFAIVLLAIFTPQGLCADNLVANPSFELVKNRDQLGGVFEKWGDTNIRRLLVRGGDVPHSGKTSALLLCSSPGKIRIAQPQDLEPGRYRVTAYIRGLDIGTGQWNSTTEFMFDDKYFPLKKNGSSAGPSSLMSPTSPHPRRRPFFRVVRAGLSLGGRRVDGTRGR